MWQWTLGCMCFSELWFSLGIFPVMGLLGHMVVVFSVYYLIVIYVSDLTHHCLPLFHSITWAFCYFSNASNICSLSGFCSSYSHNLGHSLVANLLTASSLPSFRWLKGHFLWEVFQHTINHCPSLPAFYHDLSTFFHLPPLSYIICFTVSLHHLLGARISYFTGRHSVPKTLPSMCSIVVDLID